MNRVNQSSESPSDRIHTGRAETPPDPMRLLEAVVNAGADETYVLDRNGRFVFVNLAGARALGKDSAEIVGKTGLEVGAPAEIVARFDQERDAVFSTRSPAAGAIVYPTPAGPRYYEYTWTPLPNQDSPTALVMFTARDCTERRQNEENLGRWQHVFTHAGWAVAILEPANRTFLAANPAFARMHGCTPAELVGRPMTDLLAPEEQSKRSAWAFQRLEPGEHLYEARHIRKDGTRFPVRTHVSVVANPDGQPVYAAATFQDLTESKQIQAALIREEKLLSTTLRSIGDAVIATDMEGRIRFMNPLAEKLTGWTHAEAHGRQSDAVFHIINEQTRRPVPSPIQRVLEEGVVVGLANHTLLIARDGQERPIADSGAPIRDEDGNLFGVVLVFRDVTEQKQARLAHERLAAIIASSNDAIVSKDLNGIITSWNRAAESLYGYTAEEAIGRSKSMVMPRDQPDELANILRRIRQGEHIAHYETRRVRKDGALLHVSVSVSPLHDADGTIIGASTIVRDMTARKHEEAARQFLTDASDILASSLDYEQTLQKVADLAVPSIADWCAVDMREEDGAITLLGVAHVDPEKVKWGRELRRLYPPRPGEPGLTTVLETGRSEIYPNITDDMLVAGARDPRHLEIMRQIGFRSIMIVPILARKRVLGAITFVTTHDSGHHYDAQDLVLAEGLAARAALAIENARLYRAAQQELAERRRVQDALIQHQAEIEALNTRLQRSMRETHHRVKNNLQVISALVNMQQMQYPDQIPIAELQRLNQHIRALAAIHDLLTFQAQSDAEVSDISVQQVIEKLIVAIQAMVKDRMVSCDVQDLLLPVRQCTAFAILVNELIFNAVKHGDGDILLRFRPDGAVARLEVLDEGPGFPEDFQPMHAANTGLDLIDSLARMDLRGEIHYQNRPEGGASVLVQFPIAARSKTPGEG